MIGNVANVDATNQPFLKASDVGVLRSSRQILSGISCTFQQGELSCIVGPNGAGKSTLLKVLSAEEAGCEGSIAYRHLDIATASPLELAKQRAVVPQSHDTNFPFLVKDIIAMAFDSLSIENHRDRERHCEVAIQAMDASLLWERRFDQLSGGEQQRVLCARALVQVGVANNDLNGRALFLDEPTSSLDIQHQLALLALLRELTEKGLCVILVLHDLSLCFQYADQVLLIAKGELAHAGQPAHVLTPDIIQRHFGVKSEQIIDRQGRPRLFFSESS